MTIEEILDEFEDLDSWDERCDYLIDIGLELPDFPVGEKTETNRVHGCQSNVWMLLDTTSDELSAIAIRADSDAIIVRGLIAVLLAIYSGKTAEEILAIDVRAIFSKLGLDRHLSPMRRNGLNGMVKRIRDFAIQTQA
jgi:cysteine desulfuration protein SufE